MPFSAIFFFGKCNIVIEIQSLKEISIFNQNKNIMKTLAKISFTTALFFVVSLQMNAQNNQSVTIVGSGNVITKTVTTQPYQKINVSGSMDVYLEKGTEGTISVTAEDNVQERIVVESDGETLTITMKNNTSLQNTKKIKITVPFEELSAIALRGSGNIEGKDKIETKSLALSVQGSGDIELSIETGSLSAEISGSGDIELKGKATAVEVSTRGSGDFEGAELISDKAQIAIKGSGDTSIQVNNSLSGAIQGSGSILYGGNPSSNQVSVRGSGQVKPM